MAPPLTMGIYPSDSVSEVAQSLPLDPVASGAPEALAADVEYRLHTIVQEAKKFMVAGKRNTLMPEDIEYAMEALNVEPILIPPRPLPQPSFQPISVPLPNGSTQTIYHVPDDEIDFQTYLKEPLPAGLANSAGVKWKAHWLAVEGVQPAIPENPAPSSRAGPSRLPAPTTGPAAVRPNARSTLPQELQLYFSRLTSALVPTVPGTADPQAATDAERHRLAALESLRQDAAVGGILIYIVKWFQESIQKCLMGPTGATWGLIQGVECLLRNESVFLEPYLHQLIGPIMSVLLTVPLGPWPPAPSGSDDKTPYALRGLASNVLRLISEQYASKYPGLLPRITSTLTGSLYSTPTPVQTPTGSIPPAGRYEGAILGLAALGPNTVRATLFKPDGEAFRRVNQLAGELYTGKNRGITKAWIRAMGTLVGPRPDPLPVVDWSVVGSEAEREFGPILAKSMERKHGWLARELVQLRHSS